MAKCIVCSAATQKSWYRLCLSCYRRVKNSERQQQYSETHQAYMDRLRQSQQQGRPLFTNTPTPTQHEEVVKLRKIIALQQAQIDKLISQKTPQKPSLSQKAIQSLLRLCHPDRHSNSELSNEVTKWLLEQRR